MADLESTEMIREEPLISPDYPLHKTKIVDGKGNVKGYVLACGEGEIEGCVLENAYNGPQRELIIKKMDDIMESSGYPIQCLWLISDDYRKSRILRNFRA